MVRTVEFEEKVDKNGHAVDPDGSLKYDPKCSHCEYEKDEEKCAVCKDYSDNPPPHVCTTLK